jgi:Zn-dependent protease
MDSTRLFTGAVQLLVVLLGVTVHEAAHAFAARSLGDPTAALLGRASFNPLRHLDPVGTLLVPLVLVILGIPVFGWGRPTPVLVQSFSRPRRDDLLVTAAGAVANSTLAVFASLVLPFAVAALGPQALQAGELTIFRQFQQAGALAGFPVVFTLVQIAYINAFLTVFNLLPLPPLDGGQIVLHLMPPDWAPRYAAVRPYGFTIGLFLATFGAVTLALVPFSVLLNVLIHLVGLH